MNIESFCIFFIKIVYELHLDGVNFNYNLLKTSESEYSVIEKKKLFHVHKWSFPECAKPPAIQNGTYTVTTNGSLVTYRCPEGTAMTGNQTLSCDTSGLGWLGTIPTCSKTTMKYLVLFN